MKTEFLDVLKQFASVREKIIFYDDFNFLENNNSLKEEIVNNEQVFIIYSNNSSDLDFIENAIRFNSFYMDNIHKLNFVLAKSKEEREIYLNLVKNVNPKVKIMYNGIEKIYNKASDGVIPYSNSIKFTV